VSGHVGPVSCVRPWPILTERLQARIPADRRERMTAMHPLGRLGTPEDVACAALFLFSACSSWITGITLDVAGGQILGWPGSCSARTRRAGTVLCAEPPRSSGSPAAGSRPGSGLLG